MSKDSPFTLSVADDKDENDRTVIVKAHIGEGTYSMVLRGELGKSKTKVSIKVFCKKESSEHSEREITFLRKSSHANILSYIGHGQIESDEFEKIAEATPIDLIAV
jgi:serine/threonine protein kinase